jgi:hypothetical protein
MNLIRYLLAGNTGGVSPMSLASRLAHPWGSPASPRLRTLAEKLVGPPSAAIAIGEALLVSVDESGLWCLTATPKRVDDLQLRGSAAASAQLAHRLVTRDLPLYAEVDSLHRAPRWFASAFAAFTLTTALDGESYGLSIALATASRVLGLPMASGLVASAALCADGSLERVGGLRSKVRLVVGDAPGVTRFLVARGQEAEALEARDEALRDHGVAAADSWLVIEPVGTFHEAFELAFPGALDALRARWSEPVDAERLAEELYRTAIYGTPMVLGWSAIATCAHELSVKVASPTTRARLDAVRAIARRHAGHGAPMPWPDEADLTTMPRSRRLRLLAHVVQSAADVGTDAVAQANRALSLVRPRLERAPEDAVILGAIGRAMAAGGDDDAATNALREAVDAWSEVGSPHESSHALCELLRLLAIAGRREEVVALCERAVADCARDPRSSEKSIGYVRIAAGRALVQIGNLEAALGYLSDDGGWPPLPPEAEGARERWWARALDGSGRRADADQCRERLDARRGRGVALDMQASLAELDRARRDGESTSSAIEALEAMTETRRTLDSCPEGIDRAEWLAERSRY